MNQDLQVIGRSEVIDFPVLGLQAVPARIDTGAKTSSIWASDIRVTNGKLRFVLFDAPSQHFSAHEIETAAFTRRIVASSNGLAEERYVVKLVVVLAGRRIRASFTLANRASQAYPVLVGRNILRGKFLVDVKRGLPTSAEKIRSQQLQSRLHTKKEQS